MDQPVLTVQLEASGAALELQYVRHVQREHTKQTQARLVVILVLLHKRQMVQAKQHQVIAVSKIFNFCDTTHSSLK